MTRHGSRCSFRNSRRAVSPAISMVIITAATVVLVLVAGSFALQVLDQQQATTEFNAVQKSILAFDDAVRDVAWKQGASRSVRFAISRGSFQMISDMKSFEINVTDSSNDLLYTYSNTGAIVKYLMPDTYVTLGSGYSSFILGDNMSAVSSVADSLGQVEVSQESGFAGISLGYRARISGEESQNVGSTPTNYVDIFIIKLSCADISLATGDFDLVAKNIGVQTETSDPLPIDSGQYNILVSAEGLTPTLIPMQLDGDQVVFNVIIGEVRVST